MGQKSDPRSLRVKIVKNTENDWFALDKYPEFLLKDYQIKKYTYSELKRGSISKINIKRKQASRVILNIYSARPGVILGKSGHELEKFKSKIQKVFKIECVINIIDEKKPELSAKLLSEVVTSQLEKRIPFRRAMKMIVQSALKAGAEGIQVACSGRLGGVEIARSEGYQKGRMPKQTLRTYIDYWKSEAHTIYGIIGVSVWVNLGEKSQIS